MRQNPTGSHLNLAFSNLKNTNVLNSQVQQNVILEILKQANITVINKMVNENQNSLHFIYMFKGQGHFAYYSNDITCFSIDVYTRSIHQFNLLETLLNEEFNWSKCTTNVQLVVNNINKVQFIDQMPDKSSLLQDIKYIKREQTPYQELRIYDTHTIGRVLVLDEFINISDNDMVDEYTQELPRHITKLAKNNEVQNILIIGGGDCLIVNYLLKNFPNIKKITMAEIDRRVVENIQEYFTKFSEWVLDENLKSGRLVVNYVDGSVFVKEQPDNFYDGVVIDSTDQWNEESPSYVLTTPEFYKDIKRILKKNCACSQMMSHPNMKEWFVGRMKQGGFEGKIEHFDCPTPQYGGITPFGYFYKDDQ